MNQYNQKPIFAMLRLSDHDSLTMEYSVIIGWSKLIKYYKIEYWIKNTNPAATHLSIPLLLPKLTAQHSRFAVTGSILKNVRNISNKF